MKNTRFAILATAALALGTLAVACNNSGTTGTASGNPASTPTVAAVVSPAAVQAGAAIATETALSLAVKDDAQRKIIAADCYAAAGALRALSAGQTVSVSQFQTILTQYGGANVPPAYSVLAGSLTSLYQSFYPALMASGNSKQAAAYLEALAEGVEAGASGAM